MRTTLTLDRDIVTLLGRLQKRRKTSTKALVNEALRIGLKQMMAPPEEKKPYKTPSVSLGRPLFANLDNTAEVLAVAESDSYK